MTESKTNERVNHNEKNNSHRHSKEQENGMQSNLSMVFELHCDLKCKDKVSRCGMNEEQTQANYNQPAVEEDQHSESQAKGMHFSLP